MQFIHSYIHLLLCMGMLFLAAACCAGGQITKPKLYMSFCGFALFQAFGEFFGLLEFAVPEYYWPAHLRLGSLLISYFILFEFTFQAVRIPAKWHIPGLFLLAALYCCLASSGFTPRPEHLAYYTIALLASVGAAAGIIFISSRLEDQSAALYLKLVGLFVFAPGIAAMAEQVYSPTLFCGSSGGFHMVFVSFRVLCVYLAAECLWLRYRKTDFFKLHGRRSILWIPPAGVVLFAVLGFLVPQLFLQFGVRLEVDSCLAKGKTILTDLCDLRDRMNLQLSEALASDWLKKCAAERIVRRSPPPQKLDSITRQNNAVFLYLLDETGVCIESSDVYPLRDFRGTDFSFRSYFRTAQKRGNFMGFSFGTISKNPGLYISRSMGAPGEKAPVAVIRDDVQHIFSRFRINYTALVSPEGTILCSSAVKPDFPGASFDSGAKWTLRTPSFHAFREKGGFVAAELSTESAGIRNWRIIVGIETVLPMLLASLGGMGILLLWLVVLLGFVFYLTHLRFRNILLQNNQWRLNVFNSNVHGIVVTTSGGRIADVNDTALAMLDCPRKKLFDLGLAIVYSNMEKGRAFVKEALETVAVRGIFEDTVTIFTTAGTQLFLKIAAKPLAVSGDSPAGGEGVIWIITDETEACFIREKIRRIEDNSAALLDNAPEHIFQTDLQGFLLESNDSRIRESLEKRAGDAGVLQPHLSDCFDSSSTEFYLRMIRFVAANGRTVNFRRTNCFLGVTGSRLETMYPVRHHGTVSAIGFISRPAVRQKH